MQAVDDPIEGLFEEVGFQPRSQIPRTPDLPDTEQPSPSVSPSRPLYRPASGPEATSPYYSSAASSASVSPVGGGGAGAGRVDAVEPSPLLQDLRSVPSPPPRPYFFCL